MKTHGPSLFVWNAPLPRDPPKFEADPPDFSWHRALGPAEPTSYGQSWAGGLQSTEPKKHFLGLRDVVTPAPVKISTWQEWSLNVSPKVVRVESKSTPAWAHPEFADHGIKGPLLRQEGDELIWLRLHPERGEPMVGWVHRDREGAVLNEAFIDDPPKSWWNKDPR